MSSYTVVAPGRPITREIATAVESLFSDKFPQHKVHFVQQCFEHDGHFAGSDIVRREALEDALYSSKCDIVWFARGGYGSCRIINDININRIPKNKYVVGYSDGCFILSALFKLGFENAFHAPMPIDITRDGGDGAITSVVNFLSALTSDGNWQNNLIGHGDAAWEVEAPVYACNLSVLSRLIGTPYMPDLTGYILVIEDIAEHLYAIDRMLFQVFNCKECKGLTALALGQFTLVPENDVSFGETVFEMAKRWSMGKVKICDKVNVGHVVKNHPLRLGERIKLSIQSVATA